jgi:hypothetical protein
MAVYRELRGFVLHHRRCGVLRGDADAPTATGYRLWITCPCGARFERWITPEDAEARRLHAVLKAFENRAT